MISDAQGGQVRAVGYYYVEKRKTFGGGRGNLERGPVHRTLF